MALGDPHLVRRMEGGRSLTLRTADRVLAFVAGYGGRSGGARDPPRRPRHRKPSREPRRTIESELEGWMCERMADRPGGGEPVAH